jgi:gluconate 2-dehydrogenase gamma chain
MRSRVRRQKQAMNAPDQPGRRGFLKRSITIVPAAAALSTGALVAAQNAQPAGAASTPAASASPYTPTFFQPAEWAFIQAAVARLIPADDLGPGALEAGVPEFIDRQMEGPFGHGALWYMQGPFVEADALFGYQGRMPPRDVYRAGMAATDRWCAQTQGGKTFAQLAPAAQDEVLKALESGKAELEGVAAKTFFGFLWQNTREGYLSDPMHGGNKGAASWKMIGFPGARADYADWVGRPGERYPFPPVTIHGPQGG